MSDRIVLTARDAIRESIEVDGLTADRLAALSESEIEKLPAWQGAHAAALGDFFTVNGGGATAVHLEGPLSHVHGVAAAMAAGELTIHGDCGRRVGASMTGGTVRVTGNVADDAGAGMAGGLLHVTGNAGDRLGASTPGAAKGMTGGEIIVLGAAGTHAAARARRGLIVVGGGVGEHAAHAMIAGTLLVLGPVGAFAGRANKRGSIVATGMIDVPITYRYACTFAPPHLRVTLTYLQRRHGVPVDPRVVNGLYTRFCGDAGEPGKGEILAWTPDPSSASTRFRP